MHKHKVVIEVRDGMVQGVYSNIPDLEVVLIDWDSAQVGEDPVGRIFVDLLSQLSADAQALLAGKDTDSDLDA